MTPEDALAAIPIGRAYRFVREVVDTDGETRLITRMSYEPDLEVIAAHAGLGSLIPGTVMAEQAAQTALLLAFLRGDAGPDRPGVLGAIKAQFDRPAMAPVTLDCRLRIVVVGGQRLGFSADIVAGKTIHARISGACAVSYVGE